MRKIIYLFLLIFVFSCQTLKVKNESFKTSKSNVELGVLGESKTLLGVKNNFQTNAFITLNEKIKVEVAIVPFTKQINKVYQEKAKFNQNLAKVKYIDSLPNKPEAVSLKIADISLLVNELNQEYNSTQYTFIKDNERTSIVTSLLVYLSQEELNKIRLADSYYLIQTDVAKYNISLYKQGKKAEVLDLATSTILGYEVSKFCWSENQKGKWQIGDIVNKNSSCKGETYSKIKPKKEKSLYKM
jgi:hypothetical protein